MENVDVSIFWGGLGHNGLSTYIPPKTKAENPQECRNKRVFSSTSFGPRLKMLDDSSSGGLAKNHPWLPVGSSCGRPGPRPSVSAVLPAGLEVPLNPCQLGPREVWRMNRGENRAGDLVKHNSSQLGDSIIYYIDI